MRTMAMLGANCTKKSIFIAEIEGGGSALAVKKPWPPVACTISSPTDVQVVYDAVKPLLAACVARGISHLVLLACASGMHGASNETVKVEGVLELAAAQLGMTIEHVTPQSLSGALGCAMKKIDKGKNKGALKKESWQSKSKELFNPNGDIPHWLEGMCGAVAAVYKVTKPPAPRVPAKRKASGA